MSLLVSEPGHPGKQVISQDAGLKQGRISPKILSEDTPGGHLVFTPFDPILTGRPFSIEFMSLPGSESKVRHLAKKLILGLGE